VHHAADPGFAAVAPSMKLDPVVMVKASKTT
jgi:hypothetical protein